MKLPHIVLAAAVVVCALASLSPAATYYVDASGGDDSRDGLSPALAWKTIAKVNGSSFFPGDQILFKRGEVWRESLVPPSSGSSENPIRFDSYGSGDAPTITGYQDLPAANWTLDTGNIWKASITSTSFNYILFQGSIWGLKHTSKASCVAPYDFYFASNVLYVYSIGNPASYYGSVAAMLMTNGQLIYINGKTWIEIQHLKLSYYDSYGLRIGGASDHITIANVYADGVIPAGALPHGFFVNSTSNPSDINFYNVDAHRNYDGFRFMGAAGAITMRNCRAYGNRNYGLEDTSTGGGASYDYCHFYGNGIGVLPATDVSGGNAGTHNLPQYTAPATVNFQRYPARITLTEDDPGLADAGAYVDSWLPEFDARGVQPSIAIVTGYDTASQSIPKFQEWINAGRDLNSHSWSHQYFQQPAAFTVKYAGAGTAATLSISGNLLTTQITGGPGGENLSLDLTSSSYNTLSKLWSTIAGRGGYTVTPDPNCKGPAHSITLADVGAQDIKGSSGYTLQIQESRLIPDEMATSKAWMTANLTGLSATRVYVYPGGQEDTSTEGYAVASGYAGARGALSMSGVKDVYARGVNIQNITSLGANVPLIGLTAAEMDARIAALVWKSSVWGAPYGIFWHTNELTPTEIGNLLDALIAHGATIMTNTQLVSWLSSQSPVSGTTSYVATASGPELDFRPTLQSPVVDAGVDLGAGYGSDLLGVDQAVFGAAWDIGAFAYISASPFVVVVR